MDSHSISKLLKAKLLTFGVGIGVASPSSPAASPENPLKFRLEEWLSGQSLQFIKLCGYVKIS
jgi:hypothetical protein